MPPAHPPKPDEQILAFLAAGRMENLARYRSRGRHLQSLNDVALLAEWKRAFLAFAASGFGQSAREAHDDADAELEIRSGVAPYDDPEVAAALASLVEMAKSAHDSMTPDQHSSMGELLLRDIDAAFGRGKPRS